MSFHTLEPGNLHTGIKVNPPFTSEQKELLSELKRHDVLLFGKVIRRKYSLNSPVYLDLRDVMYERGDLMWKVGGEFMKKIQSLAKPNRRQVVIGVPDTATPLATAAVLYSCQTPSMRPAGYMLLRKELKAYGSTPPSRVIGGSASQDCEYNLIDDVVASGLSKWRAVEALRQEGIEITRIVTFFDRQQGGTELLEGEGLSVHSIFSLLDVLAFYREEGLIDEDVFAEVSRFVRTHRFEKPLWR